jgi:hypothetical protein
MPSGGDIIKAVCVHPDLGTFTFFGKAGEDSTYSTDGYQNDADRGMVDGGGRQILKKTLQLAQFKMTCSWDMATTFEIENMSELSNSTVVSSWTFYNINNVVYKMKGTIVDSIDGNGNTSTIPITVNGMNFQIV